MTLRIIIREKTICGEHNLYEILLTSVEAMGVFDIVINCTIDVNLLFAYIIITTNANIRINLQPSPLMAIYVRMRFALVLQLIS